MKSDRGQEDVTLRLRQECEGERVNLRVKQ